jgi:hypothetical protein
VRPATNGGGRPEAGKGEPGADVGGTEGSELLRVVVGCGPADGAHAAGLTIGAVTCAGGADADAPLGVYETEVRKVVSVLDLHHLSKGGPLACLAAKTGPGPQRAREYAMALLRVPARPSPASVRVTPSEIMPNIMASGQGLRMPPGILALACRFMLCLDCILLAPIASSITLQVLSPSRSCIRPGLRTVLSGLVVVFALTQPLDSCMTIARTNRWSIWACAAYVSIALRREANSAGVLSGMPGQMFPQDLDIRGTLACHLCVSAWKQGVFPRNLNVFEGDPSVDTGPSGAARAIAIVHRVCVETCPYAIVGTVGNNTASIEDLIGLSHNSRGHGQSDDDSRFRLYLC